MSTYTYERSISIPNGQLDVCPKRLIQKAVQLENEILERRGSVHWHTSTEDVTTYTARGPMRLVEAWAEVLQEIQTYKPKARGW